ncbi:MAG: hypothetical protein ACK4NR_10220 [Micavibrio sp.]
MKPSSIRKNAIYGLFLAPLLIGLAVYVAWLITGDENLVLLGVFLLPLCMLFFMIGLIALPFIARSLKKKQDPQAKKKTIILMACLMLNFPVAFGIMWHVDYSYSFYQISVTNQSDEDITTLRITDPAGRTQNFPKILANETQTKKMSLRGEGSVDYKITLSSGTQQGTLIGYITSDLRPADASLTIFPDGHIQVIEK